MKSLVSGDHITTLHRGKHMMILRGYCLDDGTPVVVKKPHYAVSPEKSRARLVKEHNILQHLACAEVITCYGLQEDAGDISLLLEDFAGVPLSSFTPLAGPVPFLRMALRITTALSAIHNARIMHLALKPANILAQQDSGQLRIINFSHAAYFSEQPDIRLSGSVAYMSPEQTGKTGRHPDYRSDLYSLGVILYELLTGLLPFSAENPHDIIHQHIARLPVPPHQHSIGIPGQLSLIIMKLLAKSPEDRYQSAYGLLSDVQSCLELYESHGEIPPFTLALHDMPEVFTVSGKLYGREAELSRIESAFKKSLRGNTTVVLVSGYSGVGKTSLIQEFYRTACTPGTLLARGKFDQFRRNTPFGALIHAFASLVGQILACCETEVVQWRETFLSSIGANVRILTDLVPGMEVLLGQQPELVELPPVESENRFFITFQNMISVFASPDHPLVLFLDDLQWADAATLKMMELFAATPTSCRLLIIGAYRDNEAGPRHLLTHHIEEMRIHGARLEEIILEPLDEQRVNLLVADSLDLPEADTMPLSGLLVKKTQGNPFFVNQFLKALYDEQMLCRNQETGQWQWDLEQIDRIGIADNVVELMVGKIQLLPNKTRETVTQAACLGNSFEAAFLAAARGISIDTLAIELDAAVREGLILAEPPGYRFLHDRVQQAAYSLLGEEEKKELHFRFGKLLLTAGTQHNIFEIVNHLNYALELIDNRDERIEFARLNLEAGRKARKETAYVSALTFFTTGIALLPADCWEVAYDLAFPLYLECAECEYLTTNFDEAERLYDLLLNRAGTRLERVRVLSGKITLYENMGSKGLKNKIITYGFQGLKELGITNSAFPVALILIKELVVLKWRMRKISVDDIVNVPTMSNEEKIAAIRLLADMIPAAYCVSQYLIALLNVMMVKLSLKFGHTELSPFTFVTYGVIEGSVLGNYGQGYLLGEAGMKLNERFNNKALFCKTGHIFGCYNNHWRQHVRAGISVMQQAYQAGLECGEQTYTAYNGGGINIYSFFCGEALDSVLADAHRFADFCCRIKVKSQRDIHMAIRQTVLNLKGMTVGNDSFSAQDYDEGLHVQEMRTQEVTTPYYQYTVLKAYSLYIFGDYRGTFHIAAEAEKDIFNVVLGMLTVADCSFFLALSALALYPSASFTDKIRYTLVIRRNRKRMKKWADNCPENFLHKLLLIEAELCRIKGQDAEAVRLYERAIQSAGTNGYIHNEAIANELAAKFQLEKGMERIAGFYITEAHRCYTAWGATGKTRQLEEQYPGIFRETPIQGAFRSADNVTFSHAELDQNDVVLASQAIFSSISPDALIKNLMRIVIRHAGATRGLLLMEHAGTMHILAEGKETTEEVKINRNCLADEGACFPASIALLSRRTGETVVLANASTDERFAHDPYLEAYTALSVICIPLLHQGRRNCMLYLENDLMADAFTADRLSLMNLLSSQIAISLENALLQKEKDGIVRIVHDSLSADIYNIFLLSEGGGCSDATVERNCKMKLISETAGKGLQTIRDFLFLSSKESIVVVDLVDMVRDYAFKLFTESETELEINDPIGLENQALSYAIAFSLFLVCKEALANIRKHAKAGRICFSVELKDNSFHLELSDDGIGFDPDALAGPGKGLGNIRTRALEMGAILNLTSDPGMGTTFQLKLPLSENMNDVTAE